MHAYYFVDEGWVYRGVPKEGPPACSGQTAGGDEDDNPDPNYAILLGDEVFFGPHSDV